MPTKTNTSKSEKKDIPKKKRLGKGLSALLEDSELATDSGFVAKAPIDKIVPNPYQPRKNINPEQLMDLADSIRTHGIIEPLIVTNIADDARSKYEKENPEAPSPQYQLVAGERRWRAAKLAQLETVPVVIKDITDQETLELAIIENIQRKDLNALEEAYALNELYENYKLKMQTIADRIGKDISTISNKIRLLKLPQTIKDGLLEDKISESHAYQILTLKSKDAQLAVYKMVIDKSLSVAGTEKLIRKINLANKQALKNTNRQNSILYDEHTAKIHDDLSEKLGKGFKLTRKQNGGKITIPFKTEDQLNAVYKFIKKNFPE